jgi:CBS domain containing-hemolysin-like protein
MIELAIVLLLILLNGVFALSKLAVVSSRRLRSRPSPEPVGRGTASTDSRNRPKRSVRSVARVPHWGMHPFLEG